MAMRNTTVNAIAPTGTISIIAGCSSGIEPLFSLSYTRNVLGGTKLIETSPLFEDELKRRGLYSQEFMSQVRKNGSIQNIAKVPEDLKRLFITSFDVSPEQHLRIQAAFQKFTDNSVSKTVNLPNDATVDDVRNIYLTAHKLKCKGITIYRYGSKTDQVLAFDSESEDDEEDTCFSGQCNF